jgi:hypothetical protein
MGKKVAHISTPAYYIPKPKSSLNKQLPKLKGVSKAKALSVAKGKKGGASKQRLDPKQTANQKRGVKAGGKKGGGKKGGKKQDKKRKK